MQSKGQQPLAQNDQQATPASQCCHYDAAISEKWQCHIWLAAISLTSKLTLQMHQAHCRTPDPIPAHVQAHLNVEASFGTGLNEHHIELPCFSVALLDGHLEAGLTLGAELGAPFATFMQRQRSS